MLYFFGEKKPSCVFSKKKLGYNAEKTTEKVTQHGLKDRTNPEPRASPMMRW